MASDNSQTTTKQTPCANVKINGCNGIVQQKGTILFIDCEQQRKLQIQSKRENTDREIMGYKNKIKELEEKIVTFDLIQDQYEHKLQILTTEKTKIEENHIREIEIIQNQRDQDIKQLEVKLRIIQMKNDEFILTNDEFNKRYDKLKQEIEQREQQNVELQKINSHLVESTRLNTMNVKYDQHHEQLLIKNKELIEKNDQLRVDNEQLKKMNDELTLSNQKLIRENTWLFQQKDETTSENSILTEKVNRLEDTNKNLKDKLDEFIKLGSTSDKRVIESILSGVANVVQPDTIRMNHIKKDEHKRPVIILKPESDENNKRMAKKGR